MIFCVLFSINTISFHFNWPNMRMPMMRLELATPPPPPPLSTECSSQWPKQLKNYCWERVEFIQLGNCIVNYIFIISQLWLTLIREVQWFYWAQELLIPAVKFTVRMPVMGFELATPRLYTGCSSYWAKQLKSCCWEGVEFVQLVNCIIIYLRFSTVVSFLFEKYCGSTG